MFNRKYTFKWWIFHCHVSFRKDTGESLVYNYPAHDVQEVLRGLAKPGDAEVMTRGEGGNQEESCCHLSREKKKTYSFR